MAISIYEGEFSVLSNFSSHKVLFNGVEYMTAEHAYQTEKFDDKNIRERIMNAKSAYLAREYGQEKQGKKKDWDEIKVDMMKEILVAKYEQHDDVKSVLLSTGTEELIKDHPKDYFWGVGCDKTGENVLGKLWMSIRGE